MQKPYVVINGEKASIDEVHTIYLDELDSHHIFLDSETVSEASFEHEEKHHALEVTSQGSVSQAHLSDIFHLVSKKKVVAGCLHTKKDS